MISGGKQAHLNRAANRIIVNIAGSNYQKHAQ
jgi:hypothetical protein